MERLKNKTILIGREPSNSRLLIYIPEIKKYGAIGDPGSVPESVTRCKIQEGVAHAKIFVEQNGCLTLTNIKPQNTTYVNGSEIMTKRITPSNTVELGKDHYAIDIPILLESAKKLLPPTPESPLDISHLNHIWTDYHNKILDRQRKQKYLGIIANCSMLFTISGGAIAGFANKFEWGKVDHYLWFLPGIGLIVYFISMYLRVTDKSIEDTEEAQNEFQQKYVAPCCNHFFGTFSYSLLKNQLTNPKDKKMYCPKCKRELIEKK